jgi:hypothetical protein
MRARRAAIAVLAAIYYAAAGCMGLRPDETRLDPIVPMPLAYAGAIEGQRDRMPRAVETFTIVFMTFIPGNHVIGPSLHPQSYCGITPPLRLAFAGDDRGYDVDAKSYRAKQVVTVVPDEAQDADGLLEGSKQNLGGASESFVAQHALADGRIDDRDKDGSLGDCYLEHGEIPVGTEGMIIDGPVRLGPHSVSIRLRTAVTGGPRNRLVAGSPSIDWDIGITIDTTGPEPTYEVVGSWDGYPAAELYINRQPVFTFTPGNGLASPGDLLKLLPGYADFRFVRRGTLSPSAESHAVY